MDVNVKVTVDLGDKTMSLFNGFVAANQAVAADTAGKALKKYEEEPAPKADVSKPEPEKRTRRTKEQIAADEALTVDGWGDMDDGAKLEAIKTEVTKHTKKGKSADIKFLLSQFDAGRASELSPEDYDAFFDAIIRYGKGESVEKIFSGNGDLD